MVVVRLGRLGVVHALTKDN